MDAAAFHVNRSGTFIYEELPQTIIQCDIKIYRNIYIYIYIERERERERENHIIFNIFLYAQKTLL